MPISVQVCIPSRDGLFDDDVLMRAHASCAYAAARGINCELARVKDAYSTATCRNRGVAGFLKSAFSHLLFVDDDVLISEPTIAELLAAATDKRIVSGCIPSIKINEFRQTVGYVQVRPVGGDWLTAWPTEEVESEAVGGGCMLIPRTVLENLGHPWFRWPESFSDAGVRAITDDADFCERVRSIGYSVVALPSVRCGHKKRIDVACLIGA